MHQFSKKALPIFEELEQNEKALGVKIAKVNAAEQVILAAKHKVKSYPTGVYYREGRFVQFKGQGGFKKYTNYIKKLRRPLIYEITKENEDQLQKLIKEEQVVIAYFQKENEIFTTTNQKLLEIAAKDNLSIHVVRVIEPSIRKNYNLQDDQNTIVFSNFNKEFLVYPQPLDIHFQKWYDQQDFYPFIYDAGDVLFEKAMKNGNISKLFLVDEKEEDIKELAKQHKEEVLFVLVDSQNEDHAQNVKLFATGELQSHTAYMINAKNGSSHKMKGLVSLENIQSFIQDLKDDKLQRTIFTFVDSDGLDVVEKDNYEQYTTNPNRDAVILYYNQIETYEKKIYESYQKLVKKIRKVNKNLKFGKNDLSKHSRPPVKLPGIPCIQFFQKGENPQYLKLNLITKEEQIIEFLKNNTVHPWVDLEAKSDL